MAGIPKPELFLLGLVATTGSPTWQEALFHPVSAMASTRPSVLEGAPQPGGRLAWALCSFQSSMNRTTYPQWFLVSLVWGLAVGDLCVSGAVLPLKVLGRTLLHGSLQPGEFIGLWQHNPSPHMALSLCVRLCV